MASADTAVTEPQRRQGYPVEIFPGGSVNIKFLCSMCNLVLRNPHQRFCGHRYCKDCIEEINGRDNVSTPLCPACISEGVEVDELEEHDQQALFPDNAIRREMANLEVRCSNPGCNWTGTFRNFIKHFEEHVTERGVTCPLGCSAQLEKTIDLDEHVRSQLVEHLELINSRIRELENQRDASSSSSIVSRLAEVESRLENLRTRLESLRTTNEFRQTGASAAPRSTSQATSQSSVETETSLSMTASKMQIIEGVITVLNREVEKLTNDVESMERQRRVERELLDNVDRKARSLERILAMKDAAIAELSVKITGLEQSSYDGTLLWRITEVGRKRQEAISGRTTSVYSPPFYTSRTGYKMCIRVYLNGDGAGRGTHMSVFFVMMRGNYDALLRWPFRQKVTFTLLNHNQRDHIVDAFRPDPTSSSFKRPTTEMNIASGCPSFCLLSTLDKPSSGFIRDDHLFLKVQVDLSELAV